MTEEKSKEQLEYEAKVQGLYQEMVNKLLNSGIKLVDAYEIVKGLNATLNNLTVGDEKKNKENKPNK